MKSLFKAGGKKMVTPWQCVISKQNQSFRVFSVRTDTAISPKTGEEHDFYILETGDWINIIPITDDRRVVMVKQYRHGAREITLEIPGGMVEPGDTPEETASRELLEETGYQAREWIKIGSVNPNPAIFGNRCHTFLARGLNRVRDPMPDLTEDIEVVLTPLSEIPKLIRSGEIDHAIIVAAFCIYFLQSPDGQTAP
jgi:ADP-ribose pyrophosphatase